MTTLNQSLLKEGFVGQKMIVLPSTIKKKMKSNAITQSFYITDIGYYPNASHHYRERKKGAKEFIFIYCIEGEGVLSINGKERAVMPHHFFIINKNTPHHYWANDHNPWSIYWLHFDGTLAQHLYERYQSSLLKKSVISFDNSRIQLFDQIYQIYSSDYIEPKMEYSSILGLNFISSFLFNEVEPSIHHPDNIADTIIAYLTANLNKSFKAEDIAREFKYSPSYLFNLFKKKTGYSLIHFFNLKKTQKACEYLNYTNLTIKEISYRMGFEDPLYFSRLFKKHMGMSPKQYKGER